MILEGNNFNKIYTACKGINYLPEKLIAIEKFGKNKNILILITYNGEWKLKILSANKNGDLSGNNLKVLLMRAYDFNTEWTKEELKERIGTLPPILMIELQNFYCNWLGFLFNGIIIDTLTDDENLVYLYLKDIAKCNHLNLDSKKRYLQMHAQNPDQVQAYSFDKKDIINYVFTDDIAKLLVTDENFSSVIKKNFVDIAEYLYI